MYWQTSKSSGKHTRTFLVRMNPNSQRSMTVMEAEGSLDGPPFSKMSCQGHTDRKAPSIKSWEIEDPPEVKANSTIVSYLGISGSLLEELTKRLPHSGPNSTVYGKIEEAVRGTAVELTIKSFARRKDCRGAFEALIANHAGDTKYRSIMDRNLNLLQNIKWSKKSYPLESHLSNHRQEFEDLRDCAQHITVQVPSEPQSVEYLIDSIACSDSTLQAVIGLLWANTNQMREHFEEKSIGTPTQKVELANGSQCWAFSSSQYIQNAIRNVEKSVALREEILPVEDLRPGQATTDQKLIYLLNYWRNRRIISNCWLES